MLIMPKMAIPSLRPHRGLGQNGEVDAQNAVDAHLQENTGQDDRDRRRSLDVRVRQPGMEWEHRYLDGERDEHAHEHKAWERHA